MKRFTFIILFILCFLGNKAQDTIYARQILAKLTSEEMAGRGYVNAGDKKSAYYIQDEFKKLGLKAFDSTFDRTGVYLRNFVQPFYVSINTFPDEVIVRFDKKTSLRTGIDYIISPSSAPVPVLTAYQVIRLEKKHIKNEDAFDDFFYQDFSKNAIVIDPELFKKEIEANNEFYKRVLRNEMKADLLIILEPKKLTFNVSGTLEKYPTLYILKSKFPEKATEIFVQFNTNFIPRYETQNVVGMIKGTKYPDSVIVIGAHYDHLGRLGPKTYFPGANDNAAGIAMMLDLAKFYADPFNMPEYSIAFIAFGAEELGLLGSTFYTENPKFPLSKIALMINLDLVGTGEKGMMIVNATKNRSEFTRIKNINSQKKYLIDVQSRGPAANSDHHPFDVKGVKAVFVYLMGDYPHYHDIDDTYERLPLGGYIGTFKLLTDFLSAIQKSN